MRKIIFYKHYFLDFYEEQSEKGQEKIDYCLQILSTQNRIPTSIVKHITGSNGIYEIRTQAERRQIRVLFFFESGDLISGGDIVVLGNGFIKKGDKDLKKALKIAQQIRKDYFDRDNN